MTTRIGPLVACTLVVIACGGKIEGTTVGAQTAAPPDGGGGSAGGSSWPLGGSVLELTLSTG
ncbi:MAG TPA: hypothetical protein VM430_08755 [Microbacterium sp.]|jgi:hypothetical protein|nr:hypothetical protein [Microbacterium sp.]